MPLNRDPRQYIDRFYALPIVSGAALEPGGARVAYVVTSASSERDGWRGSVRTLDILTGAARTYTHGGARDRTAQWSPDALRLYFISDRSGRPQAWCIDVAGGEPYAAPEVPGSISEIAPSPEGRRLAVIATPDMRRREIERRGWRRIDRLRYRADGSGYLDDRPQLWVVDFESGAARELTDGSGFVSAPAWSPDGRRIAYAAEHRPTADAVAHTELWIADADGRMAPRKLHAMQGVLETPSFSPDGTQIAFCGHDDAARWSGLANVRLYTIGADGHSGPHCLTPDVDWFCGNVVVGDVDAAGSSVAPRWLRDGSLAVLGTSRGSVRVFHVAQSGGTMPLTPDTHCVFDFSVGKEDEIVFNAASPQAPPELYLADRDGRWRQISEETLCWVASADLRPVERRSIAGPGGPIDVWRVKTSGNPRRPCILQIHGGPHFSYGQSFFYEFQMLAAAGYHVVFCNPRGSQGYGEAFAQSIAGDWAVPAYKDCMAALEGLMVNEEIDERRLGVAGGSYGGYMTAWVIGHTTRFAAAVAMRAATNLESLYGTSEVGRMLVAELGGRPNEIPEVYRRNSPLSYADRVRTPVLLIHGERDYRCPIEQAEQYFTALRSRGTEVELLRFLEADHGLSRTGPPNLRAARLEAILGWFDRHLGKRA